MSSNSPNPANEPCPATLGRRLFLKLAAATAGGAAIGAGTSYALRHYNSPAARVTILKAASYRAALADIIRKGLENYPQVIARARPSRRFEA